MLVRLFAFALVVTVCGAAASPARAFGKHHHHHARKHHHHRHHRVLFVRT